MKANKTDVQSIISTLSTYSSTSSFVAEKVAPLSILDKDIIVDLFRDTYLRMRELYSRANSAGLVINSMIDIFSSDIEKLEDDIKNLKLFIDNYEFLSGKDDYFNFNYLEKFDNSYNSYLYDGYTFVIPDRDGQPFPQDGNGFVDSIHGAFKMGSSVSRINVLDNIKSIKVEKNYLNYVTSESSFESVINDLNQDAWMTTIKSPSLINNDLVQYSSYFDFNSTNSSGAQSAVELEFSTSVKMDSIRIKPVHGNSLKLLQLVIFTEDTSLEQNSGVEYEEQHIRCLDAPRILDSITDIHFPESIVRKVLFIFNQPAYMRSNPIPLASELNSKHLQRFVDKRVEERRNSFSLIQDIVFYLFRRKNTIKGLETIRRSEYDTYSHKFPQNLDGYINQIKDELFMVNNTDFTDRPFFAESAIFADLVASMSLVLDNYNDFIDKTIYVESSRQTSRPANILSTLLPQQNSNTVHSIANQYYESPIKNGSVSEAIRILSGRESYDNYEYSFGIGSIDFYVTKSAEVDKACYVSKKINTDGQVVALKAKVKELKVDSSTRSNVYDISDFFSHELSISNSQTPSRESDWIPILPYDADTVSSEVLFFDTNSLFCNLRFRAVPDSIILYVDGMIVESSKYSYVYASNRLYLQDPNIFKPLSTWCASYEPDLSTIDAYQIDFEKYGVFKDSAKRYYGQNGSGEIFYGTGLDRTIDLSYVPYVRQKYIANSSYNAQTGTVFADDGSGYSPITVRLLDGTLAINMTNYTNRPEKVVFPTSTGTFYVQNGKKLIFNTEVQQSFVVEYEYIPNDTRFRLITRKNVPEVVSSAMDSVLLKMKVINFNPYYDKLRTINSI